MKILNAMFSKVNGGLEQVFLNYIPALTAEGNDVISVIHPKAEIKPFCPKERLITIHNFNQYDPVAIYKLRRLIQKEKPDCIITHSYRAAYLLQKTRTRVPKIAVCHVKGHYNFGSDAIIALTETMRQEIIQTGIRAETVFTVPNMIAVPKGLRYREPQFGEAPVLGVCARFAPIKGVDIFIRALAELKKRNVRFKARIAGDGKEKETYLALINALELEQDITLVGWITDHHAFYQSLDIFCLPSREEAFGLVILESMLHSLPMVLSALPGPQDIAGASQSALFATPEDPMSMADQLQRVIEDKNLARQMASNAFRRVQDYAFESVAPLLHATLSTICANYNKP